METELSLAESYTLLSRSPAFLHLQQWIHDMVTQAEGLAVLEKDRPSRAITRWQALRSLELGIQSILEEQAAVKAAQLEEVANARAIERDRTARNGW